ncbi:NAD(P)H-binding protein [Streptosporangium lutulentum]|uniref:NAD(P)H dehydrogenase (Quinone) n=1 Tax=Streptosporangium lutulentum TaxID=1461250 RepID=A0ABT9Q898_9ACTN|nr:NAD(P)H-binding protein [Streptosporangium lutulentum]MDP9842538.1 NAD(P)H dehydrogenase (quinone) [Streptosporangium lutulentum]
MEPRDLLRRRRDRPLLTRPGRWGRGPPAGFRVAIARTPDKTADLTGRGVEVRRGDYDDAASLDTALKGVDLLLLVSGSDLTPGVRVVQHRTVLERAVRAGVRHVVYTSGIGAENGQGFSADHAATEEMIGESGLTYTLLRNTFYSEAFVATALAQAKETGEIVSSTEGRPLNTARLRDLALAAGAVLSGSGHDNAIYELRGPLWTYPELAEALARVLRRPVTCREVTDAEAGWLGSLFPMVRAGAFAQTGPDLSRLLGRPATGLEDTITAFAERAGG